MSNIEKAFEQLGLTENELEVYSYLLRKGSSTGNDIYTELRMDKSSAYRSLKSLMRIGLIYSTGESRNQKYTAFPVETLFKYYEKKKKEFDNAGNTIKSFVDNIEGYIKDNYKATNVRVYEGEEGYIAFMEDRLEDGVEEIIQLGPQQKCASPLSNFDIFIKEFIRRRVEKGIRIKTMFASSSDEGFLDKSKPELLKEARKINKDLDIEATIAIYGEKVGFYSVKSGLFIGVVMEDKLIADLLRSMYMYMWEDAKEVY